MLAGADRKTGERLDDLNIRYQIITFLIAGHETTSGLLSFAINALVNHPEVLERADRRSGSRAWSRPFDFAKLCAGQPAPLHHSDT